MLAIHHATAQCTNTHSEYTVTLINLASLKLSGIFLKMVQTNSRTLELRCGESPYIGLPVSLCCNPVPSGSQHSVTAENQKEQVVAQRDRQPNIQGLSTVQLQGPAVRLHHLYRRGLCCQPHHSYQDLDGYQKACDHYLTDGTNETPPPPPPPSLAYPPEILLLVAHFFPCGLCE